MSFPNNPVNGATTITNNILYVYNSTLTAWVRSLGTLVPSSTVPFNVISPAPSVSTTTGALIVAGGAYVNSNIFIGLTGVYGSTGNIGTQTVGLIVNTNDAVQLPVGPTGARPKTPNPGTIRWNSTFGSLEVYSNTWTSITQSVSGLNTYSVSVFLVAGGGSGAYDNAMGGGGGAGGVVTLTTSAVSGLSYSITIGAGGTNSGVTNNGNTGSNSVFSGITAFGGGGGNGSNPPSSPNSWGSGGSGSGGSDGEPSLGGGGVFAGSYGAPGVPGQGYSGGGSSQTGGAPSGSGGGGGGAGGPGGTGTNAYNFGAPTSSTGGGVGGTGTYTTLISTTIATTLGIGQYITGTNQVYFAGGGGGGCRGNNAYSPGGWGGGGGGSSPGVTYGTTPAGAGIPGLAYSGGGGGAGGPSVGAGGSGVAVVSYTYPYQLASGGTIASFTTGSNTVWVHVFTASGVISF